MRRICVFCGSAPGIDPVYAAAAGELGAELAARGIELVTGGGRVGLMGVVADAALAGGGSVTGVIPRSLQEREIGHTGLTDLRVVGSLHERKQLMHDLSDAFVALPAASEPWTSSPRRSPGRNSASMRSRSACSTSAATSKACSRSSIAPSLTASSRRPTERCSPWRGRRWICSTASRRSACRPENGPDPSPATAAGGSCRGPPGGAPDAEPVGSGADDRDRACCGAADRCVQVDGHDVRLALGDGEPGRT